MSIPGTISSTAPNCWMTSPGYLALPESAAHTVAVWTVHTHCYDAFTISPRLAITSPEKGCGKTTLLDVLSCMVARPLPACNAEVAAIFRVVEKTKPTLPMDEADCPCALFWRKSWQYSVRLDEGIGGSLPRES
jgi:hypothetical protein